MFSHKSREGISLAFLLVASITFQSFGFMGTSAVYAQKQKPLKVPAKPSKPGNVLPNPPLAPIITATKTDAYPDPNADGKADPGETITYTVTIANTGTADATGVQFNDAIDPNTTLVNGSTTTQPIASPDSYNVIGNVRIQVPDGASDLMGNDCDPDPLGGPCTNTGLTITTLAGDNSAPFAGTSTNGGQVTATTGDGSFQYNPAPGFAGADTFTYTVTDGTGKTDTATATLQVGNGTASPGTNVIWFIDPSAGAGGDGRLTNPFNCYTGPSASCFSTTAADDIGDSIFLYSGAHTGGNTLLNNQKLIGAGASATLASLAGVTVPTFSDALPATGGASPTMTTAIAATNAVNLAQGNTLRGFTIGNTTGAKISGNTFGTLTVGDSTTPDMTLNGTGQALNLTTGTFAATSAFASVTTTSSAAQGISLQTVAGPVSLGNTSVSGSAGTGVFLNGNSGNITFADLDIAPNSLQIGFDATNNTGTISSTSGTISVVNAAGLTVTSATSSPLNLVFDGISRTSVPTGTGTGPGIGLTNATGTFSAGGASSLTGNSNAADFLVSGGTVGVTYGGAMNQANNQPLVSVSGGHTGTINFNTGTLLASGGTGAQFDNADGTYNFNGQLSCNGGDAGVDILNGSGGTFTFASSANISNPSGIAFVVNGGTANVTYNGAITKNNNTQATVSILGGHTGTVTFQTNAITAGSGTGLQFNNADGTYNFSVASGNTILNGGDAGIDIIGGSGGTFTFGTGAGIVNPTGIAYNETTSTANVTYNGSINQSNAANAVNISTKSGGTTTFTGAITANTSTAIAISLTSNTGGTINFSGGNLGITTTTGKPFTATSGGTIKVTGAGNTLATNTAGTGNTVLEVDGVTIGTGGLNFVSLSGNGNSAIAKGVYIHNAGSGGLTVTGVSTTAGTGGTIQNYTQKGIHIDTANNITLNNMNISGNGTANLDPAGTCGDNLNGTNTNCAAGVDLETVTTASMTGTHISGGVQQGLNGHTVTSLTLTNVEVNNAGNEANESGIQIHGLFGTMTWSALNIHDNASRQINIQNSTNTTLNLTLNNTGGACTFANTSWPGSTTSAQGILFSGSNSANMTISVQNCTIARNFSAAVQSDSASGANINTTFNGGSLIDNGQHFVIASTGSGNMTYNLTNVATAWIDNTHTGVTPISIYLGDPSSGTFTGTISGNTFGLAGTANSAACNGGCNVIEVNSQHSTGLHKATITGNTIQRSGGGGIDVHHGSGPDASTTQVKIESNTLTKPDGNGTGLPITVVNGAVAGDIDTTCANILSNVIDNTGGTGTWNIANAIRLRNAIVGAGPYTLPGYGGAATDYAAIVLYLNGRNTITGGSSSVQNVGSYSNTAGGADCYLMLALGGITARDGSSPVSFLADQFSSTGFRDGKGNTALDLSNVRFNSIANNSAPSFPSITTSLTQPQLDSIVTAAIQRWAAAGLTQQQFTTLPGINFDVTDLAGGYLGEADSNRILVSRNAQGRGWFIDPTPADDAEFGSVLSSTRRYTDPMNAAAGHVDLLTAIEHEMGHRLGLDDSYAERDRESIMYGYLTVGERRLPASGQARGAQTSARATTHFLSLGSDRGSRPRVSKGVEPEVRGQRSEVSKAEVSGQRSDLNSRHAKPAQSDKLKFVEQRIQKSEVRSHHGKFTRATLPTSPLAPPPPACTNDSGHVCVQIGTLRAGDSVQITFQVTVNNPYSGGPNVSNQGSIFSNEIANTLTDDPAVGGSADPTLTPINSTNMIVNDAQANEPPTGTNPMLFTVTLSQPAGGGGVSVNYATADQAPAAGHAVGAATCDGTSDYQTTNGTLNFASGERVKTIGVPICADNVAGEPDETFLLNLSGAIAATVTDAQAVGTIKQGNTAGTFIISELRTRGAAGTGDDFVELYNNTNSPLTVAASDASAGYGLYKMGTDCNATPVLIATIPNGTVMPARGHYLVVGSTYSLANYGGTGAAVGNQTMTSDIEDDHNVAVFSTADINNISSANRLDAAGFNSNTGNVCDLMKEGTALAPVGANSIEYSYFRKECDFVGGCQAAGNPKDTNDNTADFLFADTQGTFISGVAQHLGAPGPENLGSPIRRDNAGVLVALLDATKTSSASPNRDRDFTAAPPTAPNGTLYVRRRVQNTTGATVTRLRFRIVELTTFPSPGVGTADLRAITSLPVVLSPINDAATCASTGTPTTAPCQVTAQATVLETPPNQPNGGGYNSTLSVTLPGGGLINNASIDVNFALGVVQGGTFRFYIIVEALP